MKTSEVQEISFFLNICVGEFPALTKQDSVLKNLFKYWPRGNDPLIKLLLYTLKMIKIIITIGLTY